MDENCKVVYKLEELQLYKKIKKNLHFVKSLNVKEAGEPVVIHTLEGDVTVPAGDEMYIMIGAHEDIYPIPRGLFESKYEVIAERNLSEVEAVAQRHNIDAEQVEGCRLKRESYVYARKMEKDFSVYTKHCDSELFGNAGDYYAVTYEDPENVYIIQGDIMEETYEKVSMEVATGAGCGSKGFV